jgi:hypothetical protein
MPGEGASRPERKRIETRAPLGIAGGAVYDALVALAAKEHGAALATRRPPHHGGGPDLHDDITFAW